jgi:glycosyltransferase involved in cell wall biosynthesis
MKIYFIGQKGIPGVSGGVEKHVEELSTRLVRSGHDVFVYTRPNYTDATLKQYKGVNLISLPSIPTKRLDAISHTFLACFDLIIFRKNVDIAHFHSIGPSSLIWLIKIFRPSLPVVFTFHSKCYNHKKWGFFARAYLRFSEYLACRLADQVVAVSKSLQQYIKERYNIDSIYIPNGTSISKRSGAGEIKKLGLKKGGYILSVSRLVRVKGIHNLIIAYNRIKTDKKLVIVGDALKKDKYYQELKELAGSNPNIIFTGVLRGRVLRELYANAYLFVQPSESEGLSVSLLEAMSFGSRILVSNIEENVEAIAGKGGVFKNLDVLDLEKQLKKIICSSENRYRLFYIDRVKKEYNWLNIAKKTLRIYQS